MDLPTEGNHLVSNSDSATALDNLSTLDPEDSVLGYAGGPRPRRHDDEDDGSDMVEEDDLESTTSAPVSGHVKKQNKAEEEKELPPHACA